MLLSYIMLYIISVLSFAAKHVSVFRGAEAFETPKCRFVPILRHQAQLWRCAAHSSLPSTITLLVFTSKQFHHER
jgi:hypothetical protein